MFTARQSRNEWLGVEVAEVFSARPHWFVNAHRDIVFQPVTRRYYVKMAKRIVEILSQPDSHLIIVFLELITIIIVVKFGVGRP